MRNEELMRLLAALGGVFALVEVIVGLEGKTLDNIDVTSFVIALILAIIVLASVISPDKPIPLNWMIFVIIGIIMIVYSSLIGGVLVLLAGFVGYTER
ncbi:hypothetical protein LCGC14_0625590 [marine sediment metagenome]|uniref:Uncharacterized protein n=1 Tax=marine sediment metagenome TaxID=412755 RepID=A0A0F9R8I1_9ZZZZ